MSPNFVFLITLIGLFLANFVLWALCLRLGLRWARVMDVTGRRVAITTAVVIALNTAVVSLFLYIPPSSDEEALIFGILQIAASIILPCAVISIVFMAPVLRAFQAWLPTLLVPFATLAFAVLVVEPYLFKSFIVPTNNMAPTLVGQHWRGKCPECGASTYCTPEDRYSASRGNSVVICDNFHVTQTNAIGKKVQSNDRFTAARFVTPRRWDLITFQLPSDPSVQYVDRLVGLPGEKIHIADGCVWVNGVRHTLPKSIAGIKYEAEIPGWRGQVWGTVDNPAQLGDDEYFVLGDFPERSIDSRFWEQGAPGHNPFAVPHSNITGVAIHTFWPLSRWAIHR